MSFARLLEKISKYVLPEEIDFFGKLGEQSAMVRDILGLLQQVYVERTVPEAALLDAINDAYHKRNQSLAELNRVLITPIDKEAISRAYINLNWVVLSVCHLHAEISVFEPEPLIKFRTIFENLTAQMATIVSCFALMKEKKFDAIIVEVEAVFDMDDKLIQEYSAQLKQLFDQNSVKVILREQEILKQLKEISKRIHVCANTVEDFVSKLN